MTQGSFGLASIIKASKTRTIGRNVLYYPSLPSTMDKARSLLQAGIGVGTVVLAGQQTAGKGRLGRKWLSSPDSSLLLSVILRPAPLQLPLLNMIAGLATVHSIEEVVGLKASIKWPNDVLISGKKVAGILMQNVFEGGELRASIVGIGINVNLDASSFPEISAVATSLSGESGRDLHPWQLLPSLLRQFDQFYDELGNGRAIYERWLSGVETLGKVVQVRCGDSVEEGYAASINEDGSITLRRSDGSLVTLVTGE